MENISIFFRSMIDQDTAPVVVCNMNHEVVYMNPAAIQRYHCDLTGQSIKYCHHSQSNEKIDRVVAWFKECIHHNRVFTSRNDKENKDVYMIALRDNTGELIGYYEKHEYRTCETVALYDLK